MQMIMPPDFIMQSRFRFNCVEIYEHNVTQNENIKLNIEYYSAQKLKKLFNSIWFGLVWFVNNCKSHAVAHTHTLSFTEIYVIIIVKVLCSA